VAEPTNGHDEAELAAIARHALHDEELVAAFAAGDLDDTSEQARARALIERCTTCRDLHRDLVLLRTALRGSGTAAERAATMTAPRDFRLSSEDALRLRPGSPLARVAARLGWRARLGLGVAAFGRPVGAAMATFGVVGLLIGSLTIGGLPVSLTGAGAAPSAAPGAELGLPASTSSLDRTAMGPAASGSDTKAGAGATEARDSGTPLVGSIVLLAGSFALLVLGLGVLVAARRMRLIIARD
jgi:hypothetical protein